MQRIENDCVDCGLPCIASCPYKNAVHYYCDHCGEEEELYEYEGEELCIECIAESLVIINE